MIDTIQDYDFRKKGFARFLEIVKKAFFLILLFFRRPRRFLFLLNTNFRGFFVETGFFKSYEKKLPVDGDGLPLPWVTYSFIYFVEERLKKDFTLFEYGLGNSTKFYASHVKNVTSIEHVKEWVQKIQHDLPSNVEIIHEELGDPYVEKIRELNSKYDVIIVDGRKRVECLMESVNHLTERGVAVLDDSFRKNYQEAIDFMLEKGFKKIDFWGPAPSSFRKKSTTIFYRENNCLDI